SPGQQRSCHSPGRPRPRPSAFRNGRSGEDPSPKHLSRLWVVPAGEEKRFSLTQCSGRTDQSVVGGEFTLTVKRLLTQRRDQLVRRSALEGFIAPVTKGGDEFELCGRGSASQV